LARYFARLGQEVCVVRNDAIDVARIRALGPQAIVLSPGPCTPDEAGCSLDVVRQLWAAVPLLGVCLGHQAIVAALGGSVVRAPIPMHGRASQVFHDGQGVFCDIPNPIKACRYHSLVVDRASLPADLQVSATTRDDVVMAVRHRRRPVIGLQFHPESILTEYGYAVLSNFLRMAGLELPVETPSMEDERQVPRPTAETLPLTPVTF
jgi:anthranilate synthase/aminodeoxychorismate synthase-like glutamine amidotransferase